MFQKKWKIRTLTVALLTAAFLTVSVPAPAEAAVPTVSMGTLQTEPYYDTLREAFFLADYSAAGACNGWVETVIRKSGLAGDFVVGGTVKELNDAMAASSRFTLVASFEGGQSNYQEASDQMIRDVNAGKIKAGDIVIYTKNMTNLSASGPHWLHAAIVMKEIFDGTVVNYADYGLTRWKTGYIGYPTIGHALAPGWGVEYRTPMTTPSSQEGDDSGSTGYYVYRINTGDVEEPVTEGWNQRNGKWYFYEDGQAVTGWKKYNRKWYYMDADGVMQTGWQKIDGKWYYFTQGGNMHTGWKQYEGQWYFLRANGTMCTGWKLIGGSWYCFRAGGTMVTGWRKYQNDWYYLDEDGRMHTGWLTVKDCTYYMNEEGIMVTGTVEIDGETYEFDEGGVCTDR